MSGVEIVGFITGTITLITSITSKYQAFVSFRREASEFRKLLISVKDVLLDIENQLLVAQQQSQQLQQQPSYYRGGGGTRLKKPLELLGNAVKNGETVLAACADQKKLKARVFGETYMNKFQTAKSDINTALQLLSASLARSGLTLQETAASATREQIQILESAICEQQYEVTQLISEYMMQQASRDDFLSTTIPDRIIRC